MSFKSIFNKQAIKIIEQQISNNDKDFNGDDFIKMASKGINKLELKDRVNHIAMALDFYLPKDFKKSSKIVSKSLAPVNTDKHIIDFDKTKTITGFLIWPFTRYTEIAGLENFKEAMKLLCDLTKRFSSEFSIRLFIQRYEDRAFKEILKWSKDSNFHIRRLATEGTRPTLPWGQKIEFINNNLKKNLNLLKGMEKDESEYVRKSVANHLNDISKLDTDLFFKHVDSFSQKCDKSAWVKRHAMRTLLKQSHPKALQIYGYHSKFNIESDLKLEKASIKEGQSLPINLTITNKKRAPIKALIEYKIHYMKSNGKLVSKVFRLRDTIIDKELTLSKDISFKKVTTRKHYSGAHRLEIILNGKSIEISDFKLKV